MVSASGHAFRFKSRRRRLAPSIGGLCRRGLTNFVAADVLLHRALKDAASIGPDDRPFPEDNVGSKFGRQRED